MPSCPSLSLLVSDGVLQRETMAHRNARHATTPRRSRTRHGPRRVAEKSARSDRRRQARTRLVRRNVAERISGKTARLLQQSKHGIHPASRISTQRSNRPVASRTKEKQERRRRETRIGGRRRDVVDSHSSRDRSIYVASEPSTSLSPTRVAKRSGSSRALANRRASRELPERVRTARASTRAQGLRRRSRTLARRLAPKGEGVRLEDRNGRNCRRFCRLVVCEVREKNFEFFSVFRGSVSACIRAIDLLLECRRDVESLPVGNVLRRLIQLDGVPSEPLCLPSGTHVASWSFDDRLDNDGNAKASATAGTGSGGEKRRPPGCKYEFLLFRKYLSASRCLRRDISLHFG